MRYDNLSQLKATSPEPEIITGAKPAGDDLLKRINETITNFKSLVELAKGARVNAGANNDTMSNDNPAKPNIASFLQAAIQQGYGGKTVGAFLKQLEPLTLAQIMEFLKNAGLK